MLKNTEGKIRVIYRFTGLVFFEIHPTLILKIDSAFAIEASVGYNYYKG